MRISDGIVAFVGAGLTGLMCALRYKLDNPREHVVVIEKSESVGGLYGSVEYDNNIVFDHGMHVLYESCNARVDDLYRFIMPEDEWNIYHDNEKDIAGLFFNGKLQTYSHYMDLRSLSVRERELYLRSIIESATDDALHPKGTAQEVLISKFGRPLVDGVHAPLVSRMYGYSACQLDPFMIKATALDRVIILDREVIGNLLDSSAIRSRIAFPDQLNLPVKRANDQKALYPRKFGMKFFVQRIIEKLEFLGVQVLNSTVIEEAIIKNQGLYQLRLRTGDDTKFSFKIKRVIWSAGLVSLSRILGVATRDLEFQKGPSVIYVNMLLDKPPKMDRLYYFYCYDPKFSTFRVTNYSNYCPDASSTGRYPICVELWPSKLGLDAGQLSNQEAVRMAAREIYAFGIVDDLQQVLFASAEKTTGDFPVLTTTNARSFESLRQRIDACCAKNICNVGVMAESGLFFLSDVLNHAFSKVESV